MGKLTSKLDLRNISWKSVVTFIIVLILGLITGSGIGLSLSPEGEMTVETDYAIELADEQREATIETADGTIETIAAPTVESIDGAQLAEECGEDEDEVIVRGHGVLAAYDTHEKRMVYVNTDAVWPSWGY